MSAGRMPAAAAPAGSNATAESGRWSAASVARRARASAAAATRSPSVTPSGSPNRSSSSRCGASGASASRAPRPTSPVTAMAVRVVPSARIARGEGDQGGGHERAAGGAEQERRAGERREHQTGKEPVRERLRGCRRAARARPRSRAPRTASPPCASSSSARRSMPERSGSIRKSITSTRSPLALVRVPVLVVLHGHGAAVLSRISSWPYVAWSVSRSSVAAGWPKAPGAG